MHNLTSQSFFSEATVFGQRLPISSLHDLDTEMFYLLFPRDAAQDGGMLRFRLLVTTPLRSCLVCGTSTWVSPTKIRESGFVTLAKTSKVEWNFFLFVYFLPTNSQSFICCRDFRNRNFFLCNPNGLVRVPCVFQTCCEKKKAPIQGQKSPTVFAATFTFNWVFIRQSN